MFFWFTFALIFMPAIELYLLFKIGGEIGAGNTFLIIIITGILGAYLARLNGLSVLAKIQTEMAEGKMPGKQIIHAFLIFGGGLLLLTPGFVTDALGFSMVLPVTRMIYVSLAKRWFEKGIQSGNVQFYSFGGGQFRQPRAQSVDKVVEAEYTKKEF